MHTALELTDITVVIFEYLENKRDLVQCAGVCSSWFDPAIEHIWKHLNAWPRLMGVFEGMGLLQRNDLEWDFTRDPLPHEWDRFYMYSSKVRALGFLFNYESGVYHQLSSRAAAILSKPMHSAGGPLFPRGRIMELQPRNDQDVQIGRFFLSHMPQLTSLFIHLETIFPDESFWVDMCSTLRLCTTLQVFRFTARGAWPLSPEIFRILASLPNMKDVDATFSNWDTEVRGLVDSASPSIFPQLESLRLMGSLSEGVFQGSWFPPKTLEYFGGFPMSTGLFNEVVDLLSSRESSLISLNTSMFTELPAFQFRKVASLSQLQYLDLRFHGRVVGLADADIEHLATNLKQLRTVSIYAPQNSTSLTLQSIEHLINLCSNIRTIAIEVDASDVPLWMPPQSTSDAPSDTTITTPVPTAPPQTIELAPFNSEVDDPLALAIWLSRFCNRNRKIHISSHHTSDWRLVAAWHKVATLLGRTMELSA